MSGAASGLALAEPRVPLHAADPRQPQHVLQRLGQKQLRLGLALRVAGKLLHPALEGKPHAHYVARQDVPDSGESAAGIPQPGQSGEKQRNDELQTAQLISRGSVAAAPVLTGSDGGMHPVFASKLGVNAGASSSGEYSLASYTAAPNVNIDRINPPKAAEQPFVAAAPEPAKPAPASGTTRVAAAEPGVSGFFDRMAKSIGLRSEEPKPAAPAKTQTAAVAMPKARPAVPKAEPKIEQPKAVAAAKPAAPAPVASASSNAAPTITGSAPIVGTSSFDSRWSAFR